MCSTILKHFYVTADERDDLSCVAECFFIEAQRVATKTIVAEPNSVSMNKEKKICRMNLVSRDWSTENLKHDRTSCTLL